MLARAPVTALIALVVLTGCARNAILELDVAVPEQTVVDERRYALVEVSSRLDAFDEDAFAFEGVETVDLRDGAETVRFAVVTEDPTRPVGVRVRYCVDPTCSDLTRDVRPFQDVANPLYAERRGHRYVLPRAFYVGHVTSYALAVPAAADGGESDTVEEICRCAVAGCVGRPVTSYCRASSDPCNDDPDNTHFCE